MQVTRSTGPPCFASRSSTSRASSIVSFVRTGGVSSSKWAITSAPTGSASVTGASSTSRPFAGPASSASSRCSGRIPTITSRPARAATEAGNVSAGRSSLLEPTSASSEPFEGRSRARTRFIAGEPMNPATNTSTGRS